MKNASTPVTAPEGSRWRRISGYILMTAVAVILLIAAILAAATLWLTPERLTRIVNEKASAWLSADIKASNIRFSVWSTFPHLCIQWDSLLIVSRNLRDLPPDIRAALPAGCDTLASTGRFCGSVNIMALAGGEIRMGNIDIDRMRLNMVACNDSVNNYDIVPDHTLSAADIPGFHADRISLSDPEPFTYYSAATRTDIRAYVRKVLIRSYGKRPGSYMLEINGLTDIGTADSGLLKAFPFSLSGTVDLRFRPLRINLDKYNVTLGNTRGILDMDLDLGHGRLEHLHYSAGSFSLHSLADYIPDARMPEGIRTDINIGVTARLVEPYLLSDKSLPSIDAWFGILPGIISYADGKHNRYRLCLGPVNARISFDGHNPEHSRLTINPFEINGDGIRLLIGGEISSLMQNSLVRADISGNISLDSLSRHLAFLRPYAAKGHLGCDTRLTFRSSRLADGKIKNMTAHGTLTLRDYSVAFPQKGFSATGDRADISFNSRMPDVSANANGKAITGISAYFDHTFISIAGSAISARGLHAEAGIKDHNDITAPIGFAFCADQLDYNTPAADLSVSVSKSSGKGTATPSATSMLKNIRMSTTAAAIGIDHPSVSARLGKTGINLSADISTAAKPTASAGKPSGTSGIGHTPELLTVPISPEMAALIRGCDFNLSLYGDGGTLSSCWFPAENRIGQISLRATPDSVFVSRIDLSSRSTSMSLSGRVSNLRGFLVSPATTPLGLDIDLDMDTININQLAGTYERGLMMRHGSIASMTATYPDTPAASDTLAILIPRNISARIHASAKETVYTDLRLYNLASDMNISGGKASVKDLSIDSDFGHASADMVYNTSDIQDMSMTADIDMDRIDVVRFFRNFHALLRMMPQMKNLSGYLSASASGKMRIFPDMYIDIPASKADILLRGRDLKVHQDPFIRRIARMMLIHSGDDIHLADMDVRASVHDDLLELYPFDFRFDRYLLRMCGLNNFNGRLYYHIGILKSPIPFPFGINIVGDYHNPGLRFGGAVYKVDQGEKIASEISVGKRINIIHETRKYLREFIHKAAQADTIP